jgi:DNA polymerase (family X)
LYYTLCDMKNDVLSAIFEQMADIMEILGEDRFRINSYRKVARLISDLPTDFEHLLATGQLQNTPGIGKSSLSKIEEFQQKGTITAHQELLEKIPQGLTELLKIPGVGPKAVKAVYEELNVTNIDGLKKAISSGTLAELPGFGDKKAAIIKKGIDFLEKSTGRIRLDQAMTAAEVVSDFIGGIPGVGQIRTAGSVRRCAETIGDVDILVTGKEGEKIIQAFTGADFVNQVIAAGPTKGSAIIHTNDVDVHVDVRVVPQESFGAALQYFTGSKEHNVRLREIAVKAGLKLNEYGLFDTDKIVAGRTEDEIYKKLGIDYIEPVLREDRGEIQAAEKHSLPELIKTSDIKGDFHIHTTASDGNCEIIDMAKAAKKLGYKYICITDHSKSSAIAHGQSADKLLQQIEKIHKLNEANSGLTIFAGVELDILANGSLDFDNHLLAELDFVIASIHSGMTGDREKLTNRTLKAMDNPFVNCIAHPTGRLIGQREAMDIDMTEVIKHAAETGTALEVNSHPLRLDLKDTHCRMAIEAGVKLFIDTDSHSAEQLNLIHFGVSTAARGWATKADVINCQTLQKIKKFISDKRK